MRIISKLAKALGVPEENITEETLSEHLEAFAKKRFGDQVENLQVITSSQKKKIEELQRGAEEAQASIANQEPLIKAGEKYKAELTENVKKAYRLATGKEVEESQKRHLEEEASLEHLGGMLEMYQPLVEQKLGELRCQDCGSTNVSRRSSKDPVLKDEEARYDERDAKAVKAFCDTYFPKKE